MKIRFAGLKFYDAEQILTAYRDGLILDASCSCNTIDFNMFNDDILLLQ